MGLLRALASGLAGAGALTVLHETVRRLVPDAPRMDVLGMRAIAEPLRRLGQEPPNGATLHNLALAGDVAFNSLYYGLVGLGHPESAWFRGALLGLVAGAGAVALPGPLGLGTAPSARTPTTAALTVGLYLAGGLAAAAACRGLASEPASAQPPDFVI